MLFIVELTFKASFNSLSLLDGSSTFYLLSVEMPAGINLKSFVIIELA